MNPGFEAAASSLAGELTTSPQAAVNELRNDLYNAEQSGQPQAIANVEALAHRADDIAGPCAEHLAVTRAPAYEGHRRQFGGYAGQQQYQYRTQQYRQQLEVSLVPSSCGQRYAPGYAPPPQGYNPYGGQQYAPAPTPYYAPPAYAGPSVTLGIPGLGITIRPGGLGGHHHW